MIVCEHCKAASDSHMEAVINKGFFYGLYFVVVV